MAKKRRGSTPNRSSKSPSKAGTATGSGAKAATSDDAKPVAKAPAKPELKGPFVKPTAKGGGGKATTVQHSKRVTPKSTGRYTPPIPKAEKVSPMWVPVLMFTCLLGGMIMIILNYVNVLPDSPSNWWLLGGLGLITAGFITATKYH